MNIRVYWLGGLLLLGPCWGCDERPAGEAIPEHSFQYPAGIKVHPQGFALVASTNFDLTYEFGSLRAIDLNRLAEKIPFNLTNNIQDTYRDFILDDSSLALQSFSGAISLAKDGSLAAVAVRQDNSLVLVDVGIGADLAGNPSINLSCSGSGGQDTQFATCDSPSHLVDTDGEDPFDVLITNGETNEEGPTYRAYVSYLRTGRVTSINIPPRQQLQELPMVEYSLDTGANGQNDLAQSPTTGMIFIASRPASVQSNVIYHFDPSFGTYSSINFRDMFPLLLGNEIRSLAFAADGTTLALLISNPDMLVFMDTTPDADGQPSYSFKGEVVIGNNPARVRRLGDLMFVSCTQEDALYIIDVRTQLLLEKREDVCRGPFDIDFFVRDQLQWALVTCFEEDVVAVMDVNPASLNFLQVIAKVGEPRLGE